MLDIPIWHCQCRNQYASPNCKQHNSKHPERKQHQHRGCLHAEDHCDDGEHSGCDQGIEEGARHDGQRKDKSWEEDFADELRVTDETVSALRQDSLKEVPCKEACEGIGQHRDIADWKSRSFTDNAENNRAQQRLEDDPNHTERGLAVAKPDVALHQLDEEVAVVPHLKKIRRVKTIGWFNRHQWLLTQHKWLSRWDEIPFVTIPRTPVRDGK